MDQHRRVGAVVVFLFGMFVSVSAMAEDARIAIIDSSESILPYATRLRDMGVIAVGRYYGRCPQSGYAHKRIIDNAGEIEGILAARLSIVSVYQFYSRVKKFDSSRFSGKAGYLDRRPRLENPKSVADFNDCITPANPISMEEDARLDAIAAINQAKLIVGQPQKTAIYFGVDYNSEDSSQRQNVLTYFKIVSKMVHDAGYFVGVYGNGSVGDLLHPKFADYVWLSASASFSGSAKTYNEGNWNLFQTRTEATWHLKNPAVAVPLDTDIQNPDTPDVGAWNKTLLVIIPHDRNISVQKARQFVCEGQPVVLNKELKEAKTICTFGMVARTLEQDAAKNLVAVDCNEDGTFDGWMSPKDLSMKRPIWIDATKDRLHAHCPIQ